MPDIHLLHALILGFIEGLTEFLPISSTGHLILLGNWIGFQSSDGKVFEVVIQLGAILAVCWLYRARLVQLIRGVFQGDADERRFAGTVLLAFLPAALIGAVMIGFIKTYLFSPVIVAASLILGGLILLWVESRNIEPSMETMEEITWRKALLVGFAQCAAMIPGVSRSGATIVGGLYAGMSRKTAAEFSFFLAMPTMFGAAAYDVMRNRHLLSNDEWTTIAVGFVAAFISALIVVRMLIKFVASHSFRVFAWYRIALGLLVLAWLATRAG